MIGKRLRPYFEDYQSFHRSKKNELCHGMGIPLIVLAVFGALSRVVLNPVHPWATLAALLAAVSSVWFAWLDWRLAFAFFWVLVGACFLAAALPLAFCAAFFVLGWAFQLWGHYRYEGNSPAFLRSIAHLLIGPLYIFSRWVGYR